MNINFLPETSIIVVSMILLSCNIKSKTTLYLERELDILDNTIIVDEYFLPNYGLNTAGVIRDKKEGLRTMVLMLTEDSDIRLINSLRIGISVFDNSLIGQEDWNFKPKVYTIRGRTYLLKELENTMDDKLDSILVYLRSEDKNEAVLGDTITLRNLYLNND